VIGDEIRFELLLPDDWNGRLLMGGGGGFAGSLSTQGKPYVNRGYAVVGTDTGHQASGIRADWANGHLERLVNYGYLGVHRTAETAKAILRAHYGAAPARSYFEGCSNGGRQALMEAQRYPDDFDGIIAAAPAADFTGIMAAFIYNMQRIFPDPDDLRNPVITDDNRALLQSATLRTCDRADGVADGILDDPSECRFDLQSLACPDEQAAPGCLTTAQREAIDAVYGGPRNQDGAIYSGFPFGEETAAWAPWITGPNPELWNGLQEPSLQFAFGTQGFKYLVFGDPDWDYSSYDFSGFERDVAQLSSVADATDPDLSGLKASGGKLLIWHGWADPALTAQASIDYYEAAAELDPDTSDYFRLFLLPGVHHCAGGPGPSRAEWLEVMEDWVENGQAPESLIAYRIEEAEVVMSRRLCVYPGRAVYDGSGDPDDAASFACQPGQP